jgi:predicted amidohydrolase YtcJ
MRSCLAVIALASGPLAAAPPTLFTGATVYTAAGESPRAATILVEDGKIAFVGEEAEARKRAPGARPVDLAGAFVYPGLTDAHAHLLGLGEALETLDLRGKQKAGILSLVAAAAAKAPAGEWIRGRAWDQNLWPGAAFPTAAELSAVSPKHPVVLSRVDGHALWVNDAALTRAGITAETPDPEGGRIVRGEGGKPTGVFVDNAQTLVRKAIPPPAAGQSRRLLAAATRAAAAAGLTGVGDAGGFGREGVDVLRAMAKAGELPIRVYATVGAETKDLDGFLAGPPIREGRLTVRAVKVYADGALGSRGAALLSDYADDPGNRGLLVTPVAELERVALATAKAGWQLWTHAIGDRGNRVALDAYEKALKEVRPADARFRIEHAQVVSPEDVRRFAALSVIASVQPTHATSDMPWAEARVGPGPIRGAYAWRSLLKAGVRLCGGSDFPVEGVSPLLGFYAAVSRQDLAGRPPGGWYAGEKLSREEALRLFTSDNAWAEFAEGRRGRIAAGFDADLTVLDRDIVSEKTPVLDIPGARVLMTVVGGEIVHRSGR